MPLLFMRIPKNGSLSDGGNKGEKNINYCQFKTCKYFKRESSSHKEKWVRCGNLIKLN